MACRFSHFLEKAFVRRVSLRIEVRIERLLLSTIDVHILLGSGLPITGFDIASTTSGGEYFCSPSRFSVSVDFD